MNFNEYFHVVLLKENQEKIVKQHSLTQVKDGIGFSEKEKKWYGWSHRAICGFGIGDKIFEEDFGDDNTEYSKHGKKDIKNLEDAKQSAINFSDYVS
jgi:hypothetical protein